MTRPPVPVDVAVETAHQAIDIGGQLLGGGVA